MPKYKPRYRIIETEGFFIPQYRWWSFWLDYPDTSPTGGRVLFSDLDRAVKFLDAERKGDREAAKLKNTRKGIRVVQTWEE